MSTDKLQALHSALAEILSEPPSPPTFFDEEPHDSVLERGEATTRVDPNLLADQEKVSAADIGLPHKDIHEAPKIPDAEKERPDTRQTLAEQTPANAPTDPGNLAIRAQQAKSLLAGLDLDTAIRLRWVMRDIRAKRTKLSPVSENDLAALIDLGFVEMREELPRLTGLGVLALD
jgi:hypothetical protein